MFYDWSKYRFRCSSLGYIMTDSKEGSFAEQLEAAKAKKISLEDKLVNASSRVMDKTKDKWYDDIELLERKIELFKDLKDFPNLSESCMTHLCDIRTRVKYDRTEDIKSKYLKKGLLLEEDAISAYSYLTKEFHKKNTERKYNEWIEGETDIVLPDMVKDTKVNWSIFQFGRVAAKPIKPLYHWQLDGYMMLWDKPKGELIYVLLDTPAHIIAAEKKRLQYEWIGSSDDYELACQEIDRLHTYSDIPDEEKIRIFPVERSEEREAKIIRRVEECRQYLNLLETGKIIEYEDISSES